MRLPACSLLALAGCNAIFGLNDNAKIVETDAPVFPDGPLPTFKLRYLLADTEVVDPQILNEPAPLTTPGIAGVTDTRVGPLGGELFPAPYDPATGDVGIPILNLAEAPWRFRYTLEDVEHELQWQPMLLDAKASVPMLGRLSSPAPLADSGYNIQPTGVGTPPIGGYNGSRVFTTGVFLDIRTGTSPSSTQVDGTANKTFLGNLGSPDSDLGDNAVLVNYAAPSGQCGPVVNGYAQFRPPDLMAGTKVLTTPTWVTSPAVALGVMYENQGAVGVTLRLQAALADTVVPNRNAVAASAVEHGITATTELPGTIVERPVTIGGTFAVPGPQMLMLAQCQIGVTSFNPFLLPSELVAFYPRVTHGIVADRRTVGTVELVSSMISVDKIDGSMSKVDFKAPLAIRPITLTDSSSTVTSLSGGADDVPLSITTPLALSFALEANQGMLATEVDYFEITVFQIGATLIPKRVFVTANVAAPTDPPRVITTPIPLDLSGLTAGTYVLRIRSVAGAPRAALGDFETVAYPYAAASIFTRTFVIQ